MDITVRSHLIAGGAAALAAGVVLATPSLPAPAALTATSGASVELAALANPITAIISNLGLAAYWLGSPSNVNPGPNYPANSPIFTAGWLLDLYLPHPNLSPPASLSFPVTQQIVKNVFDYAAVFANREIDAAQTLVTGVLNAPAGVTQAALLLLDGQTQLALDTLVGTLVTPIVESATSALEGLIYPISGLVNRGAAAIAATVNLVVNTVESLITNTGLVINSVRNTVEELVFNLADGEFEKAWNVAVGGFLGQFIPYTDGVACGGVSTCRAGIPAQLIRSTVGGLANYPNLVPGSDNIWSIRWALAEGGQNVARALAKPVPLPTAAVASAAAAAEPVTESTPAAPEPALSKADVTESVTLSDAPDPLPAATDDDAAGGGDTGGAASSEDTAKKPGKHRVTRKAG